MKNMEIASVKLVNQGLKGIEVTYAQASNKGDRSFIDEHTSKKKAPIHLDLEQAFDKLKVLVLDICSYPDPENYEADVEMTGVKYTNKGFVLTAKLSILDGEKTINLVTPLIRDGNEYGGFMNVIQVLDKIYEETRSYMAGEKTFSDEQLVLKFNSGKEGFDVEEFKKLSADEQRDIATKVLEAQGSIIFHPEPAGEEVEKEVVEIVATMEVVKDEDSFDLEASEDFELEVKEEKKEVKKKVAKVESLKMVDGPNGSFSIVENEVAKQVSTAKKVG